MERHTCSGSVAHKHRQSGWWKHAADQQELQLRATASRQLELGRISGPTLLTGASEVARETSQITGQTRSRGESCHHIASSEILTRHKLQEENERKRRREDREKDRERSHIRPHDSLERRERSPIRKPSPKRRRVRVVPRYTVQIPKISLTLPSADIIEIKKRYQNLYVPSDFFSSGVKWIEAFPPNAPFSIKKTCSYHVMNKEVAPLDAVDAVLDPPDADYLYSAKVMLMSTPAIQDIYKKCFSRAEDVDAEKVDDVERDFLHPTRLINFLVGLRGKNETMAIGGAWSKKLDGELIC